jgi:hypothetical protein
LYSKFNNGNQLLHFSNGFFGVGSGLDTAVLPPDNNLMKFGLNGNLRNLPLGSTLSGRITYSKLTNDVNVLQSMLTTGPVQGTTGASSGIFSGNVINQSASLSLASHPLERVDTRLYWNWVEKVNKSTPMTFVNAAAGLSAGTGDCGAIPCQADRFGYKKNSGGVEASARINSNNKIALGADLTASDRNRPDLPRTIDRKYSAEWKNSTFEMVDTRVKYQYLERRSLFIEANGIDAFVRRFDLANNNQHLAKVGLDISPLPLLDFGVEAIYKHNNYKDSLLGRQSDERQEYYASVSYGDAEKFRVTLFGDLELTQMDSLHKYCQSAGVGSDCTPGIAAGAPVATTTPASSSYNWSAKNLDRSYQIGLGADWLPAPKWKLNSSLVYAKTNGTTDFAAQSDARIIRNAANSVALLFPIQNFDNTTRVTLNLKGTYKVSRTWDLTGGYAFERYRYSDIGFDGFSYMVSPATTQASYLTGAGALQNYTAQMLYMIGTFKF